MEIEIDSTVRSSRQAPGLCEAAFEQVYVFDEYSFTWNRQRSTRGLVAGIRSGRHLTKQRRANDALDGNNNLVVVQVGRLELEPEIYRSSVQARQSQLIKHIKEVW